MNLKQLSSVPDDDPLRFYRAIAEYGVQALSADGALYFETNPLYIDDVKQMLSELGYKQIELREDQFGKLRFTKPSDHDTETTHIRATSPEETCRFMCERRTLFWRDVREDAQMGTGRRCASTYYGEVDNAALR